MYIVYGTGNAGEGYLEICRKNEINDIIATDSNPTMWGKILYGYDVVSPEEALQIDCEFVVITVEKASTKKEIAKQIRKISPSVDIVTAGRTIIWNEQASYYLGNLNIIKKLKTAIYKIQDFNKYLDYDSLNDIEKFVFFKNHTRINKYMHYLEAYDRFFKNYRNKPVKVIEIGVRGGGSLQLWRDYFGEKSQIIGVDIEQKCKQYEDEQINVYIGSQEDRKFLKQLKSKVGMVDVIIDDGGHTMNQQIVSFEELWEIVKPGGMYLCEDTGTSYMKSFVENYPVGTFIEYTKNLVDSMHILNSEFEEVKLNKYANEIKSISYYRQMVFIEKDIAKNQEYNLTIDEEIEL